MNLLKKKKIFIVLIFMLVFMYIMTGKHYAISDKEEQEKIGVEYSSYIQGSEWEEEFSKENGQTSGTTGKSLRLEAIKIRLQNDLGISIRYKSHVQDVGWMDWKHDGEISGTTNEDKRLEAIQIELENTEKYSVMYRTHVEDFGWQEWKKEGEISGTVGESKRVEAIEIRITEKIGGVEYFTHIQDIGWENDFSKKDGQTAGTRERSLRLEAIKIRMYNTTNINIKYQTHIEDYGWQDWKENGEISGTTGESKRLEAIKIQLEGTEQYSVMYRAYVQDYGWQQWCYDGEKAGTEGESKRLEALEIKIVPKRQQESIIQKIISTTGYYGITGLKTINDRRGTNLKYYRYGNGPNVAFTTFAIHGFEDLWDHDGWELVRIAEDFHNTLINSNDYDLAQKWTIYIFPGVNQDGLEYGYTEKGPGRTTIYSDAPQHQGIDLNRCWQAGSTYTTFSGSRNYNGTEAFQACEARDLRDFMINYRSWEGQNILIDLHGWTQQLIGDPEICSYYDKQFGENDKNSVGRYGTGYMINWARYGLYSSIGPAKTALIELPNSGVNGTESVLNKRFSDRYISATLDMLKNIPINNNSRAKKAKQIPTDSNTKFKVAYTGMIKNETPKYDEIDKLLEENMPNGKGIWIEENSRKQILNLFNNDKYTNSTYEINQDGYLKIIEKNNQTEYDKKIKEIVNGNKLFILNISSKCYIIDDVTGEILDYNFENMDKYQVYEYFECDNNKIIFVNENTNKQLSNSEIFESILQILD